MKAHEAKCYKTVKFIPIWNPRAGEIVELNYKFRSSRTVTIVRKCGATKRIRIESFDYVIFFSLKEAMEYVRKSFKLVFMNLQKQLADLQGQLEHLETAYLYDEDDNILE